MKLIFDYGSCTTLACSEYSNASSSDALEETLRSVAKSLETSRRCVQQTLDSIRDSILKVQELSDDLIATYCSGLQRCIEDNSAILRRERHREQLYDSAQRMKKKLAKMSAAPKPPKNAGAISGALNDKNDPYLERREAHANRYYAAVRSRDMQTEIAAVSAASGLSKDEVAKAYKHLFIEKHELEKGYDYFDASYDIAVSWQRLREGKNVQPHDITLIKHEALESEYMAKGMTYQQAHDEAEKSYNYAEEALEFNARRDDGLC